ncbi:MAG: nucleoside hydrolase [Acidimicrobiia bacterium]|nr:nucleoside hydrolase [Acidimicrobiia bacterium]
MTQVLLDTDIGTDVDDALALALLIAEPHVDLVGVTTVHGHAPLRAAVARSLLEFSDKRHVPVVAGRSVPLRRSSVEGFHWNEMWGHEGAGVLSDAERQVPDDDPTRTDAARFILDAAERARDRLALITIGPVTNLALALQMEPGLGDVLGPVTIMGGIVERHMVAWPATFETNLNSDPLAAAIVLGSGLDITLVPLEVTLQVYLDRADRDRLASDGGPVSKKLVRLIEEMHEPFGGFATRYGLDGSHFDERTYLHDPLAVHAALRGTHTMLREASIAVEYEGQILRTIDHPERRPNMRVCSAADGPAFVAEWMDAVVAV